MTEEQLKNHTQELMISLSYNIENEKIFCTILSKLREISASIKLECIIEKLKQAQK